MGKITNFEKHTFAPFSYRIGNLEVRNCYMNRKTGKLVSLGPDVNFSNYEIIKWEKNPYYGTEKEYVLHGDYYQSKTDPNWAGKIHKSCFESSEKCYVVASWTNMNYDEYMPDLQFVGVRPFELETQTETLVFMELAKAGQYRIQSELQSINVEEDGF